MGATFNKMLGFFARRHYSGTILTIVAIVFLYLLNHYYRVPVINPGTYLVLAIIYTSFTEGLAAGLFSAAISVMYLALFYAVPGHFLRYSHDNSVRVVSSLVVDFAIVGFIGFLKIRNDKIMKLRADDSAKLSVERLRGAMLENQNKKREAERKMQESKLQLETILANVAEGITAIDAAGRIIYANQTAARLSGFASPKEFLAARPGDVSAAFEIYDEAGRLLAADRLPTRQALSGEDPPEIILRYRPKKTGQEFWSVLKSTPIFDNQGVVTMAISVFRDITQIKKDEEKIKRGAKRQQFLAQAGELLSTSLDYELTLKKIAELAVPDIADWAAVDVLTEEGVLKRLAVVHQDPEKVAWAYELAEQNPVDLDSPTGVPNVLRTGKTEYHPVITDEMLVAGARDQEHLSLLKKLGLTSLIIAPLKALSKTVGTITFVTIESALRLTEEDLLLAEELSRRASLAIENAKLFENAQETAKREHEQAAVLATVIHNAPVGFALLDPERKFLRVNAAMAAMSGLSAEEHFGRHLNQVLPQLSSLLVPQIEKVLQSGQPVLNQEVAFRPAADGAERHWLQSCYPVQSLDGGLLGVGLLINEITERKQAEKEVRFHAYHDVLTGLPNRKSFEETLMRQLHETRASGGKLAVMFLDVDSLKDVNDSLGHEAGDEILKELAVRLKDILRSEDMVSRWGGDEFVFLLTNLQFARDSLRVAEKILKAVHPPIRVRKQNLHVTASLGIAVFPDDGEDVHTLQKNADTALYRAKEGGKNRFEMFNQRMNVRPLEKLQLGGDLRKALEDEEFNLYYQPVLNLKNNTIESVETLLRWQHPRLGLLTPGKFLPLAEELGVIVPLGRWVINNALVHISQFNGGGRVLRVAVNVSARQFKEEDLVSDVLTAVREAKINPELVAVEVTESVAMENLDRTRNILKSLKDAGLSIIVDDFGTGYSSLNYLKRFPIDVLKIDRTFVRHMITNEQDTSIIKAIISMAESLNLKVIAEGVDTETQLDVLRSMGCDAAQGFYISRPLSRHELKGFLAKEKSAWGNN